jgi:hypothetical protein
MVEDGENAPLRDGDAMRAQPRRKRPVATTEDLREEIEDVVVEAEFPLPLRERERPVRSA